MYCPFCEGEGELYQGIIKKNQQIIYICSECDTVWLEKDFSKDQCVRFETIMDELGLSPLWMELDHLEKVKEK